MGDSPVSNTIENVAGRGVGVLAALTSLKGGGLQNYFLNRQRALADPAERAGLVDSPFTSGVFGLGQGQAPAQVAQPTDGTPAAAGVVQPQDVRYLPTGGHWYPDVSPLDYGTQVKTEQDRSTMIGLTSNDPAIRTQSKLAIGVPLTNEEMTQAVGAGRGIVRMAGPGSQVQYKLPGGSVTVGSPYISGNYLDKDAADIVAARTGGVVVPSPTGGFEVQKPQSPVEGEYTDPAQAAAARQPNEVTQPTGRTVNGVPTYRNVKQQPTGVTPLEQRPTVQPQKPAAKPAAPPPTPVVPTPPPSESAAPSPAPEAKAAPAPPAPPAPPPPPPHEVVIQNPDGSFSPAKRATPPPPPAAAPRAEATPSPAPPLLAAAAPPVLQFPGVTTPAVGGATPAPAPVMVARAVPPPYQLVPGSELSGIASGAPPAPAEERAGPPPPVPPAPTARVPWQEQTPGQAAQAGGAPVPGGMPAGTQEFSESRPLPGAEGGTVTFAGKTQAGLDFEGRRALMQAEIERQYGKIPEAKDMAGMAVVRGAINNLLDAYTPEQRAAYQGVVEPYVKRFWELNDPQYQNFLQMNAQIKDAALAAGIPEKALENFPTGMERSAADYESRLRGSTNMIDKMMAAPGVFQSMHPADLTPAKLQKVTDQYLSGPAPVHFGAYPWDDKTGAVITTTTTTTSPGPTTTTLYPVDRRYTVQPPPAP